MKLIAAYGIRIHHDPSEQETARRVRSAVNRSIGVIQDLWELPVPADLRVYVMTSWIGFLRRAMELVVANGGHSAVLDGACAPGLGTRGRVESALWP